ncbi:hypothetical protein ACWJKU_07890 [Methylocaldum sp. MU1018]
MKRWVYGLLIGSALSIPASAFAENRAVKIDVVSDGRGVDSTALRTARQIIGHAVANGTVDTFLVHSPRIGGPIPIEGGLSACAEAGFGATTKKFEAFVAQLRSIHPRPGTTFNLESAANCTNEPEPLSCGGLAGLQCPGDQICVDDPRDDCDPNRGGADCSGICQSKIPSAGLAR